MPALDHLGPMTETGQQPEKQPPKLQVEPTFGEKLHHYLFNIAINFGATLAISGLFVFWVKHSIRPLPQAFFKGKLPSEYHQYVRAQFQKLPFVKMFANPEKVANIMADALSINLPGTLTILPSAYFGAKYKAPIVEAIDRHHYGADAEDDPRIVERHRLIHEEHKPTLLGAVLARIGSMTASVATSWAIGAPDNLVRRFGRNNSAIGEFQGVDAMAVRVGRNIGSAMGRAAPGINQKVDKAFDRMGVDWAHEVAGHEKLNSALEGWMHYTALDVMYTLVTSTTIHPFVRLIGKLPFMSYKENRLLKHHPDPEPAIAPLPTAVAALPPPEAKRDERPQTSVSSVQAAQRIDTPAAHAQNV
ncbi:MAG: hypothetical protein WDN72_06730 [Alphaproteobacteria bacterium]